MDIACILAGATLMICGAALSRLRPPDWHNVTKMGEEPLRAIAKWASIQRMIRFANNSLLSMIGGAIIGSVFVPRGQVWVGLWCLILLMLLVCILLAMFDAFSSFAGYRRALPEITLRSLKLDDGGPRSGSC